MNQNISFFIIKIGTTFNSPVVATIVFVSQLSSWGVSRQQLNPSFTTMPKAPSKSKSYSTADWKYLLKPLSKSELFASNEFNSESVKLSKTKQAELITLIEKGESDHLPSREKPPSSSTATYKKSDHADAWYT